MKSHLEVATEAALKAGKLVLSMLGRSAIYQKGTTNNLVTDADTASERLIADLLVRDYFPESEILGEEEHTVKSLSAPKLWVVDPLDGTNNFAHSIPHFCISIAYSEFGEVLVGVVYDPVRDELFTAELGKGAMLNGKPISVSKNKTLSESIIGMGFYYDRGELLDTTLKSIHRLFKSNIQCVRRMGSAALDLSYVACGRFDAYYEYMLSPWDFAAGTLIMKEAGGVWSDREGEMRGLESKGIICSNGWLQNDFLKLIRYSTVVVEHIGL